MQHQTGSVASKVRGLKAEKDLRQQDIAEALGVSRHLIGKSLRGQRDFTLKELNGLSDLFGVPVSAFFGERAS